MFLRFIVILLGVIHITFILPSAPQVPPLAGGDHPHLPALPQAHLGAAGPPAGAGGLLDGLPGGGHQEGSVLRALPRA